MGREGDLHSNFTIIIAALKGCCRRRGSESPQRFNVGSVAAGRALKGEEDDDVGVDGDDSERHLRPSASPQTRGERLC